jgi:hypothetical protein
MMNQPPQPTHAALARFRMDPSRPAEQQRILEDVIVPGVMKAPGFVSGYWTVDRDAGESTVLVTFESAVDANSFATDVEANAPNQSRAGLDLLSIRIVEVVASA